MDKGKVIQLLKGYSTDSKGKLETSIDYDRIEDLADDLVNLFAIHYVSYCAEQTKNVLTNKFCNIAEKHVGKTFDEVPEVTELLKAIDVIEKHCS
jgi:intein/homing endonuclease